MYYERPLSRTDIRVIADYLDGTDEDLDVALSELGFDPCLYTEREMRYWLRWETDLNQSPDSGIWHRTS